MNRGEKEYRIFFENLDFLIFRKMIVCDNF